MAKIESLARYKRKKLRAEHGDDMGGKLLVRAEIEAEEEWIKKAKIKMR